MTVKIDILTNTMKREEPCPVCGADEIAFDEHGDPELSCGVCLEYFFEHGGPAVVRYLRHSVASLNDENANLRDEVKRLRENQQASERCCLVTDGDGHWYVIPVMQMPNWGRFCSYSDDDERGWDVPEFAKEVGGCPSRVSFASPEIH